MGGQTSIASRQKYIKRMIAEGRCTRCGHKPDPEAGDPPLSHAIKSRPMCDICRFKHLTQQSEYYYNKRKQAIKRAKKSHNSVA